MKENEMKQIAKFIDRAINNVDNEQELALIKKEVAELCSKFPLYPELQK
jgi:glycine hydroxymethyltransferase